MLRGLILLARPRQQIKNLLVFAGPLAGGVVFVGGVFPAMIATFASFVLVSASVYAFNDVRDVEADRNHDSKKIDR